MKLWILEPIDPDADGSPWDPWYDCCFAMIVRAETEEKAREIATANAKDEARKGRYANVTSGSGLIGPWTSQFSTCKELGDGPEGLVIQDVRWWA